MKHRLFLAIAACLSIGGAAQAEPLSWSTGSADPSAARIFHGGQAFIADGAGIVGGWAGGMSFAPERAPEGLGAAAAVPAFLPPLGTDKAAALLAVPGSLQYRTQGPLVAKRRATASRASFETPEYKRNEALRLIGASARYAYGASGRGVLVGVFDTGVSVNHVDTRGAVDLVNSRGFDRGGSITDKHGHGTHVTALIAGRRNGSGTHGLAYNARVAMIKGLDVSRKDFHAINVNAAEAARLAKARAVAFNNSWSVMGPRQSLLISNTSKTWVNQNIGSRNLGLYRQAAKDGMVMVWAAGNDGASQPSAIGALPYYVPDLAPSWVVVVATDRNNKIASFSNRCGNAAQFCLAAPGVALVAAAHNSTNGLVAMSGTSMAAPQVTGAIALLKSEFPELSSKQLLAVLKATARDLGAKGVDPVYGHGLIDLDRAVRPYGSLSIPMTSSISGPKVALDRTAAIGSGTIAKALAQALDGTEIMVADGFDRGFGIPAGALVADGFAGPDRSLAALALAQGGRDFQGTFAQLERDGAARERWEDDAMQMDLLRIDAETSGLALVRSFDLGSTGIEAGAGMVRQDDSLPGLGLAGAFAGGKTSTRFLTLATTRDLGADERGTRTELRLGTEIGQSRYSSDGILRSARVSMASVEAGITRKGANGQTWRVGAQAPMTVMDARFDLDLPHAMFATAGAERNTGVVRKRSKHKADAVSDINPLVDVSWSRNVAEGGRLGLGVSVDVDRPRNSAVAADFAMRF